jgi:hypothetical protein
MAEARFADLSVDHHVHWLEYVGASDTPHAFISEDDDDDDDDDVTWRGARYRALLDLRRVSAAVRTAVEVRVRDAVAEACFEVMGAYRRMLDAPGQGGVAGLPQFMSNAAWRLPESCKRQRLINCLPCFVQLPRTEHVYAAFLETCGGAPPNVPSLLERLLPAESAAAVLVDQEPVQFESVGSVGRAHVLQPVDVVVDAKVREARFRHDVSIFHHSAIK